MKKTKFIAGALAVMMLTANIPMITAFADSMPIVTIGADLSEEQRETVMSFFNVDESTVEVIEINNTQERQYLEGLVPDEKIGHKTISCSYILPMNSGGIVVKTANLTWVSDGMIANALVTAGVENCQVIATAPFPVSGTGALTGVLTAYEKSAEVELDEDKKALATEELVITGDIISEVIDEQGQPETSPDGTSIEDEVKGITEARLLEMLNEIKAEVINGNLSEEEIKAIVDKHLAEYKIELTEYTYNKLIEYLKSLTAVKYSDTIKENLTDVSERIKSGFKGIDFGDINVNINVSEDTKNWFEKIIDAIVNFFKSLFGASDSADSTSSTSTTVETVPNIFDNVDTDIFDFDKSAGDEETTEESVSGEPGETVENGEMTDEAIVSTESIVTEDVVTEGDNPSVDDITPPLDGAEDASESTGTSDGGTLDEAIATEALDQGTQGSGEGASLDDIIG